MAIAYGWGRYSGYFFRMYKNGLMFERGPFRQREDADSERARLQNSDVRCGKVYQKERPVWYD